MNGSARVLLVALGAIFTTTLDELVILTVLFAEAAAGAGRAGALRARHVVVGLNLGFTVLIGISLLGVLLGEVVPEEYLGLLGLLPLGLGLKKYAKMCCCRKNRAEEEEEGEEGGVVSRSGVEEEVKDQEQGSTGVELQALTGPGRGGGGGGGGGGEETAESEAAAPLESAAAHPGGSPKPIFPPIGEEGQPLSWRGRVKGGATTCFGVAPGVLRVAAIIVGDGGDTLSIYVPLFATSADGRRISLMLGMAYVFLALWCLLAWQLVRLRVVSRVIERWGRYLVPGLLIGLGVYVLAENQTFSLLTGKADGR